jgi:hypothetical protein
MGISSLGVSSRFLIIGLAVGITLGVSCLRGIDVGAAWTVNPALAALHTAFAALITLA